MSNKTTRGLKRKAKEKNKREPQTDDSTLRELRLPVYIVFQSEDEEDSPVKEEDNQTLGIGMDLRSSNGKGPIGMDLPSKKVKGPISMDPPSKKVKGPISMDLPSKKVKGPKSMDPPSKNVKGPISMDPPSNDGKGPTDMDPPSNNEKGPTGGREHSIVENNTVLTPAVKKDEQGGPIKRPKNMAATYSCSECSYSTDNSYNLKIHKTTHTDARPHVCPTCKFEFRLKSHLTRHLRSSLTCSESKKQKYKVSAPLLKCSSCDYTTPLGYNLKLHQRTHTDERPFECCTCGYKFRTQSHLLRHTRRKTCQPVVKSESESESTKT